MEGALDFGDELLGAAAEDERAGFGFGAVFEEVEALAADLALVEGAAGSEVLRVDVGAGGLDGSSCGLDDTLEVVGCNSACAEDVSVCEVLSSKITNWEF